jgi:hypothetical protein
MLAPKLRLQPQPSPPCSRTADSFNYPQGKPLHGNDGPLPPGDRRHHVREGITEGQTPIAAGLGIGANVIGNRGRQNPDFLRTETPGWTCHQLHRNGGKSIS